VQDMTNCSILHDMGIKKLLDNNMVASCNGGGHRDHYLVCQGRFLRIEVPLAGYIFQALNHFQYFIN
jgi:hypothetical protein